MKRKSYKSLNIAKAAKAKEKEFFKRLRVLSNAIDLSMQYWLLLAAKRKYTAKQLNKQIESLSNYWDKKAKEKAEPIAKSFTKGINGFLNVKLRKQADGISLKEKTRLLQNEFNAAIERNAALIKSIPREIIERYRSEILNNVSNLNQEALIKAFKSFSNISESRARFIARDQLDIVVIQMPLENIGIAKQPYILTIKINKDLDKIVLIRISSRLMQRYPDISKHLGDKYIISDTYTIKPVSGKITNYMCLDVIDKLLSMVENPLFKRVNYEKVK